MRRRWRHAPVDAPAVELARSDLLEALRLSSSGRADARRAAHLDSAPRQCRRPSIKPHPMPTDACVGRSSNAALAGSQHAAARGESSRRAMRRRAANAPTARIDRWIASTRRLTATAPRSCNRHRQAHPACIRTPRRCSAPVSLARGVSQARHHAERGIALHDRQARQHLADGRADVRRARHAAGQVHRLRRRLHLAQRDAHQRFEL